jgi:hypothetical protein
MVWTAVYRNGVWVFLKAAVVIQTAAGVFRCFQQLGWLIFYHWGIVQNHCMPS